MELWKLLLSIHRIVYVHLCYEESILQINAYVAHRLKSASILKEKNES